MRVELRLKPATIWWKVPGSTSSSANGLGDYFTTVCSDLDRLESEAEYTRRIACTAIVEAVSICDLLRSKNPSSTSVASSTVGETQTRSRHGSDNKRLNASREDR